MKVSIVLPVYNVSEWIERCLLSICQQTYEKLECIIVNDATPDNSMEIVDKVLGNYKGVIDFKIIIHENNRGLSAARNSGVKIATGDYLFFLDSDDTLNSKDSIALFKKYIDCYGYADFVLGGCYVVGGMPIVNKSDKYCKSDTILCSYLERKWSVIACAKFIKRTFFISNNLWFKEGMLHEDISFSFHLAFYANSMITMNEYVYTYYIHENSITTSKSYRNYIDYLSIMLENYVLLKSLKNINTALVSNFFVEGLFGFLCSAINNSNIAKVDKRLLLFEYKSAIKGMKLAKPSNRKIYVEYMLLKTNNTLLRFIIAKLGIGKSE